MKQTRKSHPSLFKLMIALIIGISVGLFIASLSFMGAFTSLENKTGDLKFRLFADRQHDAIVLHAIRKPRDRGSAMHAEQL